MFRCASLVMALLFFPLTTVAQDAPRLAKVIEVSSGSSEFTRQFFGHVAAKETVDLAFQVGGQVVEIPIVEGVPIPKGAVIAKLDLEPFELALDQARVQKDQADRTLERLQKLQGNSVSQVTVDDAQTQAQLAAISVRNAERSLRDAQLVSPFDALVASRYVANFSSINPGTPIARLHDMSELRVEIDVPEVLFQQAGRNPDVDLQAKFPASDETFPLEIREFNAETSQVGQTFGITFGMAPPENIVVLPGSSVTVFATIKGGPSTIRIPRSALISGNDGAAQVMLFTPDGDTEGTVSRINVTIEPDENGAVTVVDGLTKGQEIIASGANLLSDGARVKRFAGFSN